MHLITPFIFIKFNGREISCTPDFGNMFLYRGRNAGCPAPPAQIRT